MDSILPLLKEYGVYGAIAVLASLFDVKGKPVWRHITGLIPSIATADKADGGELSCLVKHAKELADTGCDVVITITASGMDLKTTKRTEDAA